MNTLASSLYSFTSFFDRTKKAKNLPIMNLQNRLSDTFVTLKVGKKGNQKFETNIIYNSINPVWDKSFSFGCHEEDLNDELVIKIYDHDKLKNRLIGRVYIDLKELDTNSKIARWFNITNDEGDKSVPGFIFLILRWDNEFTDDDSDLKLRQRENLPSISPIAIKRASFTPKMLPPVELVQPGKPIEQITLAVCSWNTGNAAPPNDLSPWIPKKGYRLIAIGAQECEYQVRPGYLSTQEDWLSTIQKHLGDAYTLVESHTLWEMRLLIFCQTGYEKFISAVDKGTEATGVAHVLGNKGGVVISLNYLDTSFCFVNSHLAAHQSKVSNRNENVQEIIEGCSIGISGIDILNQFHHVVWLGDLNYRLDYGDQGMKETPDEATFNDLVVDIRNEKYMELYYKYDQLRKEIEAGRVFLGFTDLQPRFAPTFKVERNSYLDYKCQRSPAYCDRILYKSMDNQRLLPVKFESVCEIMTSDHKPIIAGFIADIFELSKGIDDNVGFCKIKFKNMSATNLNVADVDGFSDPYIQFGGPFLIESVSLNRTATIMKNLNPVWTDEQLPTLNLTVNCVIRLKSHILCITAFDYDAGRRDDMIGCAYLPLINLILPAYKKEWTTFKIPLSYGGLPAGQLNFDAMMIWEQLFNF